MRAFTWLALSPVLTLLACTSESALIESSTAPTETTAAARATVSDRDKLLALEPHRQNPKGEIASSCVNEVGETHACIRYRGDSTIIEVRFDFSRALAINPKGDAVGEYGQAGQLHAFEWKDGVFTPLPELLGAFGSTAVDINARGQVVGTSDSDQGSRAVLWENGEILDLGTLGGSFSLAIAIDESGRVVGASATADGVLHYFVWKNGVMTDLGPV